MRSLVVVLVLSSAAPAWAQQKETVPIAQLESAAKQAPNDPNSWVLLGLAYLERNESPRALEAFQRAVTVGPKSAEAHNWLGVALAEKSDFPGAIAALRKAVALDPTYGRALTNLGSVLAQSGDYAEAVEVFTKALALEPNSLAAHTNLGMALRETGDLDAALEHLNRVAAAEPTNASVQYEVGQTLRQNNDLSGAIAAFEKALEINPEMREGYYALGAALKQQSTLLRKPAPTSKSPGDVAYRRGQEAVERGDLNAAREALVEALRLDDTHADAHNLLGFTLGQQGDLTRGITHLERAVALRPQSSDAHYNLGVALWYDGARERAIPELRESVKIDPAAGGSHAFLGTALREQGDLNGSRLSLQRAIALLPPTAAVYVDLAITFLATTEIDKAVGQLEAGLNLPAPALPAPDWDAAINGLRRALAQNPKHPEAHNVLGLVLGRKGASSTDVAAAFREAIKLRPDYAEAHNNLGLVLIQAGDDAGGIAALREAVRLRPDYADARANLGAAITPTDAEEAVRELEKAVALAPGSVKALFNLGIAYGSSPKHGPAKEIEQLKKAIELAPTFPKAHLALGKALLQDGKVPDAVTALQEATKLEPSNGEAHYQLGLALARAGRKDEATEELKKGRELVAAGDRAQNASLDIAEGRAAFERGDFEEATAKFQRALKLQPDATEPKQYLEKIAAAAVKPFDSAQGRPVPAVTDQRAEFEAYIRDGRFKEVEPLLAKYVQEHPTSSWAWYTLGYSQFAQQKIGDSIKSLAKSLELDLKNAEAHKILGRNLMIIGRFDAAQIEFEQAIRYKPDSAESYYNLGKLHSIQDNWEPARKAFEGALRIDPTYVEAIDALGLALESLGDDHGALANYEKAIALNDERKGTFSSAHVNLSAYYNRTGDPEKAFEYANKALALDPRSDRALFQKARAEERRGHLDEAVNALNEAISINSRASSYYYVLAGVYRRLGWTDESKKALEMFSKLEKESTELEKKRRARE